MQWSFPLFSFLSQTLAKETLASCPRELPSRMFSLCRVTKLYIASLINR